MTEISDNLDINIMARIQGLLEKPYAGSMAFTSNHEQAKYYSNCHGTTAYIFGLSAKKKESHPQFIDAKDMIKLIKKHFIRVSSSQVGNLIGFYDPTQANPDDEDSLDGTLIHTALVIEENKKIFNQTGSGGVFQIDYLESRLSLYRNTSSPHIGLINYSFWR
jgi:hypothetical protein